MKDTFNLRVDKIFGSLSSSSSFRSQWTLSDKEIERKEWGLEKRSPDSDPDMFHDRRKFSVKEEDIHDLNEDGPFSVRSGQVQCDGFHNEDDEWEVRSSIGLDCTLDKEEEEDEYDKVAVGKEKSDGDRLYMSDINDYDVGVNSYNVIPESFGDICRDPRANHIAAKNRLEEERACNKGMGSVGDCMNVKSILKRKEDQVGSKSGKRVRFEAGCKYKWEKNPVDEENDMESSSSTENRMIECVPDYIKNPSKYTCYTVDDSDEVNEASNLKSCMNFLNHVKGSKELELNSGGVFTLPETVIFTPKKKTCDSEMAIDEDELMQDKKSVEDEVLRRRGFLICIEDEDDTQVCKEDNEKKHGVDKSNNSTQRLGRQYRKKIGLESTD